MSEPFVGEIRMVGFNFAPRGWAFCQGQMLSIAQNQALFSLLGTTYGGNGTTTFGLPDLRARVPVGMGANPPGLQPVQQGQMAGTQTTTLLLSNMPAHTHQATFAGTGGGAPTPPTVTIAVASTDASENDPNGNIPAMLSAGRGSYTPLFAPASSATSGAHLGGVTVTPGSAGGITGGTVTLAAAGSSLPFSILNPYLGLNFIIALQGIFPSRN